MRLSGIEFSKTEPRQSDVLWIKPVSGGIAFYLFNNGRWEPSKVMNDQGTAITDDDTIADISNIDKTVEQEVTRQMSTHDESVGDTHNTSTNDGNDYPDVTVFGS